MASKRYIKDYTLVETEDTKGQLKKTAVYHGDYFNLNLEESEIKTLRWHFLLLFIAALALHVIAGSINNPGLYKIYVALPYTGAFFPLLFLAAGILRMPAEKRPYRNEEIGLSYKRIINMSRLYLIFMAAGLLGTLIYLLIVAKGLAIELEAIYIGLTAGASFLIWLIYKRANNIEISKEQPALTNE